MTKESTDISDAFKFAFIICVNNELYFKECRYYIERLKIPQGYKVETVAVRDAASMCSGYNRGMRESDAKYKIYLHQDVFIRNTDFLQELLERFGSHPKIGMIGMFGGTKLPKSGRIFDAWNEGKVDVREPDMAYYLYLNEKTAQDIVVEAVDGAMIATQYDLPWREDLFRHFDFYDVSQALEFRQAGYQVVIPYQKEPWIIHDCGFCKLGDYDGERKIFVQEYARFLSSERESVSHYNREWESLSYRLSGLIRKMLETGNWHDAEEALGVYHQNNFKNTELEIQCIMTEIYCLEEENGVQTVFFENGMSYEQMYEKYIRVRFLLRRIELGIEDSECKSFQEEIACNRISYEALVTILVHGVVDKMKILRVMEQQYAESRQFGNLEKVRALMAVVQNRGIPVTDGKGNHDERIPGK